MILEIAKARVASSLRALRGSVWLLPLLRAAMVFSALLVLAGIGRAAIAVPVRALANGSNGQMVEATNVASADAGATPQVVDAGPPTVAIASLPSAAHEADAPIALNEATSADLERLPGIGPKKAEAILALRTKLGRFHAIEDLLRVKGIGRKRLAKIRPLVTLERT